MQYFSLKLGNTNILLTCMLIVMLSVGVSGCKKGEAAIAVSAPNDTHNTNETKDLQESKTEEREMAKNPKINVGDKAPAWSLESDNAGTVSSDSLKGQKYILYFYPKDNTRGCTTEAIDFQTHAQEFADKGYKVFGVSSDDVDSHKEFRNDHNLEFTLLSDPDHKVAEEYGVYREKNSYGRVALGTVRSTFVVDEEGNVAQVHDNVKATGHVERLLAGL